MFCFIRTGFTLLHVSLMPLFSRALPDNYITPGAVRAINLVYDVALFFGKWSTFREVVCFLGSGLFFGKWSVLW